MNQPAPATDLTITPRLALWSMLGFWSFYLIINTLRAAIIDVPAQGDMLVRRVIVAGFGVALTGALYALLRARAARPTVELVGTVFVAAMPLALAYATFNRLVFVNIMPHPAMLQKLLEHPEPVGVALVVADQAFEWYAFIVAWGVLYLALAYAGQVGAAERQAARYRAAAQAAELRALRYQVNPHFLFNTLNSLSTLVLAGRNADAERMILNLATFFRTTLASDPAGDIPLADEIALQRLYLEIEKVRFPDRLRTVFDIPDQLGEAAVPGLILQPLIENAIKHGVARSRRPVTITVSARAIAGRLEILVDDDGDTATTSDPPDGTGTGVRNVCDRLAVRFGGDASCTSGHHARGFGVALAMPLTRS